MRALSKLSFVALILALIAPNFGVVRLDVGAQTLPRLFEDSKPGATPHNRPVKPWRARKARLRLDALNAATLSLNLFDTVERVVERKKVDRPTADRFVWHGRTDDGGTVTFAVVQGVMTGTVFLDGRSFEITPDPDGEYTIAELNPAAFPAEDAPLDQFDMVPDVAGSSTTGTVGAMADGTVEIDVMVLWTPAARNAAGGTQAGIESLVLSAVSNANLAYANSQVNARLRLVHSAELNFVEAASDILGDLTALTTNGDGKIDSVHTLREQRGADIVTLLGSGYAGAGYCGIGYLMGAPTTSFAPYAFNVVDQSCAAGNLSYAHEVGHNEGLHHDPGSASGTPSAPYAYGYQDPGGAFRTVLSYGGAPRVPYLSSPSIFHNGRVTGTSGQDNARALANSAATVASFKGSSVAPPPPPGPTTCTYSVSPTSISFTAAAESKSVTVTTQAGCAWTASAGVAWVSVSGGATSTASATVSATQNTGAARSASVVVAGATVNVSQSAPKKTGGGRRR